MAVCVQNMFFFSLYRPVVLPTDTKLSRKYRGDIFLSQTVVSTNKTMGCHNQGDRNLNKSSVFVACNSRVRRRR